MNGKLIVDLYIPQIQYDWGKMVTNVQTTFSYAFP